ncbi:bifunctional phosphopantothenoylcysteine decarboxylase/phosphopantothenate--cysteine ligase CoaBC [Prochlorococcus sp. MIT 1300]|uniref:bifunctional phosphopantothenoylcysteine decarboxylase/phosphopantothenate--cysteine ligase CoaBC n=1 Tax=Prochlorococcus sp. MIT 1300 TaxID=3096218 RepID=UPI002A74A775|nr:bifunctional phosphopantothenoylcysteine decarboxylase/phosphopantothenate--cysteine ligase CoaBC [Prochlorococcus sp. MIT 1300]
MKTKQLSLLEGRRLLVAVTGSIAAVKTPLLVSSLAKQGADVRCLVTPSASKLVSPISLASLSRNRCYQDDDQWSPLASRPLHIELAEWAELIVIAPLSSTTLGKWVHGIGEGLLSSLLLASEKPIVAAAAMNTAMWSNPAVRRNWEKIQQYPKVLCISPEPGMLACDRLGDGRMADPELIELAIESGLSQTNKNGVLLKDFNKHQILVTAGPTHEEIDAARIITNRSTGAMGVLLAQAARLRGAKVDLIHGPLQLPSKSWLEGINSYQVRTASEMQALIKELQANANSVAMAAAVGDIRLKNHSNSQKLSKQKILAVLPPNLEEVPDLLQELVNRKPPGQIVLGFTALTGTESEIQKAAEAKLRQKGCDLLFANPIDRPGYGFESNTNGGWLITSNKKAVELPKTSKLALANELLNEILALKAEIQSKHPDSSSAVGTQ